MRIPAALSFPKLVSAKWPQIGSCDLQVVGGLSRPKRLLAANVMDIRSFRATSQSITSFAALKNSSCSFSGLERADGGWSCDPFAGTSSDCLQGKIGSRLRARRGASLLYLL